MRILVISLAAVLLMGVVGILSPLDSTMQISRNKLRLHDASGSVVVVALDDRSIEDMGALPWPRARIGALAERVRAAGARRIFLDVDLSTAGKRADDRALEKALRRLGPGLLLPARVTVDPATGKRTEAGPLARFAALGQVVNANLWVQHGSYVWVQPYAQLHQGKPLASLASVLSGVPGRLGTSFPIDYAIDIRSVPVVSASDVLHGRTRGLLAGRDVLVGHTASATQFYFAPGYAMVPGIFFHALAVETLLQGRPVSMGWLLPLLAATLLAAAFLFQRRRVLARSLLATGFLSLLLAPALLEHLHIYTEVAPALLMLLFVAAAQLWARASEAYQARGTTDAISGLPNLNALRQLDAEASETVIVARVHNFVEIAATLPTDGERDLVRQIAGRMAVGAEGSPVFQADEGIFIWLASTRDDDALAEHLDGLHALFRSPIVVQGRLIDLSVTCGLDVDTARPLSQRVASGLLAADEAAREGRRWSTYNPADPEDAEWRISLLAWLDQAIDKGELWVAYQPKFSLSDDSMVGAEALARWTHPEKGDINPSQFIAAAERSGRIEHLTAYVLDNAVAAAAAINRELGRPFGMAVNLSARLLDQPILVPMVEEALARHGLPAICLILELTETSAMASEAASLANLERLSRLGVRLSIDDYGTGFSTLEYLKKIPAQEIKIDRGFISLLDKSQSDRIMVHSTIQLAHALGRVAVAEGVENMSTLDELRRMGCDLVQGYLTGRPMRLEALRAKLDAASHANAA